MREIKFRAWCPVSKKWDKHPQNFIRLNDGALFFGNANINGYPLILQQFTGLRDKSGKEIYEGDIVRVSVGKMIWQYQIKSVSGFGNNLYASLRYRNFDTVDSDELYEKDYVFGDYFSNHDTTNHIPKDCEVVGNIYENPELLHRAEAEDVVGMGLILCRTIMFKR